jgi:hypothetical protein
MQDNTSNQFDQEQSPDPRKKKQQLASFGEMEQQAAEEAPPDIIIDN